LLAPGRQPHLSFRRAGSLDAAIEVFADDVLRDRVVANLLADDLRTHPFPLIGDEPHQSACQREGWVVLHRCRQLLHPLGSQAVCFAPQSEPCVGVRVFARRGLGRLIDCPIGLTTDGRCPIVSDQRATQQNRAKHGAPPAKRELMNFS